MGSLRDELEGLIGPEALRRLAARRGGRRLYVPRKVRPLHWLAVLLGQDAADALAFRYGGCRIDIPTLGLSRANRNEEIRRCRVAGASLAHVADRFGLSERQVRRILRD